MSGGRRNDENGNKEEKGWASMLIKVAGAAAVAAATVAVAGSLYSHLKKPEPDQVAVGAGGGGGGGGVQIREARAHGGGGGGHTEEPAQVVVLTKPKEGWLKLNVDGSIWHEYKSAGCGGVLRNASGKWLRGFVQKLEYTSKVDQIEKEAILRGLRWAREIGVKKVKVESDNEGVVDSVNNTNKRIPTDDLICEIRELLYSPHWEAKLTWIPREANQVADKVADNAHALPSFDLRDFVSPPKNCSQQLLADYGAAF